MSVQGRVSVHQLKVFTQFRWHCLFLSSCYLFALFSFKPIANYLKEALESTISDTT